MHVLVPLCEGGEFRLGCDDNGLRLFACQVYHVLCVTADSAQVTLDTRLSVSFFRSFSFRGVCIYLKDSWWGRQVSNLC